MKISVMDPEQMDALGRLSTELWRCQQCGECSSVCPSAAHGGIRCGELMARLAVGAVDLRSERSIWLCATCQGCSERCQCRVDPAEVIVALRNMAAEMGNRPSYYVEEAKRFLQTGLSFPKTGMTKKMRKDLGLGDIEVDEGSIGELRKIAHSTGLGRLGIE